MARSSNGKLYLQKTSFIHSCKTSPYLSVYIKWSIYAISLSSWTNNVPIYFIKRRNLIIKVNAPRWLQKFWTGGHCAAPKDWFSLTELKTTQQEVRCLYGYQLWSMCKIFLFLRYQFVDSLNSYWNELKPADVAWML